MWRQLDLFTRATLLLVATLASLEDFAPRSERAVTDSCDC